MKVEKISKSEFSRTFNKRDYNSVSPEHRVEGGGFSEKLQKFRDELDSCLLDFLDEYYLHDLHNWSHFVDVTIESDEIDAFIHSGVVKAVSEMVREQDDDWMVMIRDRTTLFITRDCIKVFNYEEVYPMLEYLSAQVIDLG